MTTEHNYFTVSYKLYAVASDGTEEMREEASAAQPYQFLTGLGLQLEAFEAAMENKKSGDTFDFLIPQEQAYGKHEEEQIVPVPLATFEIDGKFDKEQIYEGAVIPLMDNEGNRFPATVVSINEKDVVVDLNYPLAGYDLHFVGEVIEARLASDEEVQGVVNMMQGNGGGCGCGCDSPDECGSDDKNCGCNGCNN